MKKQSKLEAHVINENSTVYLAIFDIDDGPFDECIRTVGYM